MKTPEKYSNFLLRDIIEEFVHSERDRGILIQKYCNKMTIRELADKFDVSETRIKIVMYKYDHMIFGILEEKSRTS